LKEKIMRYTVLERRCHSVRSWFCLWNLWQYFI